MVVLRKWTIGEVESSDWWYGIQEKKQICHGRGEKNKFNV